MTQPTDFDQKQVKTMKKQKGTTIVGVLIGILILSIALSAQIKLLTNTVRRETDMRNLIMATSLAREGIEIAFSWRIQDGWAVMKGMINQDICPDITDARITDLGGGKHCGEKLNPVDYPGYSASKFVTYLYGILPDGSYNVPPFDRKVRIEGCDNDPTNGTCLVLRSTVGWETDKQVEITKTIYNWYVP